MIENKREYRKFIEPLNVQLNIRITKTQKKMIDLFYKQHKNLFYSESHLLWSAIYKFIREYNQ